MVRTNSIINLSKHDLKVINCQTCSSLLDCSQKPIHVDTLLNPAPILFVFPRIEEIDCTTQQWLTAPYGVWLKQIMDSFSSRRNWTVHSLINCATTEDTDTKQVMHNCLHHYDSLIKTLQPYCTIFLGIKDIPKFKTYTSKITNKVFLDNPQDFVPMNNRIAMSRFMLTVRKIYDEKTCN